MGRTNPIPVATSRCLGYGYTKTSLEPPTTNNIASACPNSAYGTPEEINSQIEAFKQSIVSIKDFDTWCSDNYDDLNLELQDTLGEITYLASVLNAIRRRYAMFETWMEIEDENLQKLKDWVTQLFSNATIEACELLDAKYLDYETIITDLRLNEQELMVQYNRYVENVHKTADWNINFYEKQLKNLAEGKLITMQYLIASLTACLCSRRTYVPFKC